MISVLNLQPQLSGNKVLTAFILSICFISCSFVRGITKNTPTQEPSNEIQVEEVGGDKKAKEVDNESTNKEPGTKTNLESKTSEVLFFGETYTIAPHKSEFKIALILPFFIHPKSDRDKKTSTYMVRYYQGIKLALTELENRGIKVKFYLYDNKNSIAETKAILNKWEMKNMDLIIGPIKEPILNILSKYGLEKGIPVFSPISTVNRLDSSNQQFYSLAPSYLVKANQFVKYLEKNHPNEKLVILSDNSKYNKKYIPELIKALNKSGKITYTKETYSNYNNWMELLVSGKKNVVYIPSYKRSVVNAVLGRIITTKREATIFGESNWTTFDDNDYSFWKALNVHIISSDFVNPNDSIVMKFRQNFRDNYQEDPNLYAYMGYDQMMFIGEFLMAFGQHFPKYINNKDFKYLSTRYKFKYIDGFNQNTKLFFLKYEDGLLIPNE